MKSGENYWRKKSPHCTSKPEVIEGVIRVLYFAHSARLIFPFSSLS